MDRGAWWATVPGVAHSQANERLSTARIRCVVSVVSAVSMVSVVRMVRMVSMSAWSVCAVTLERNRSGF